MWNHLLQKWKKWKFCFFLQIYSLPYGFRKYQKKLLAPDEYLADTYCYICSDLLATEKHASALYDTCIFEFKNEQLRTVLNSIQREEQEHGKKIYVYMSANNMYS